MELDELELVNSMFTTSLCSALSCDPNELRSRFVLSGTMLSSGGLSHSISSILLDTGALGANFVSQSFVDSLSNCLVVTPISSNRTVRLGNKSVVNVSHETVIRLTVTDALGSQHTSSITCVVLPNLSHDVIIGLFDLFGPFYKLFAASIRSARSIITSCQTLTRITPDDLQPLDCNPDSALNNIQTTSYVPPSSYPVNENVYLCYACTSDLTTPSLHPSNSPTYDF